MQQNRGIFICLLGGCGLRRLSSERLGTGVGGRSTSASEARESTGALREGLSAGIGGRARESTESVATTLRERLAAGRCSRSRETTESTVPSVATVSREASEALVKRLGASIGRRSRSAEANLSHYAGFTFCNVDIWS
uniref:Uncharacterized protein n=1 Tax=Anopheles merus TaxID=30066 RepID=A0A182V5Z1_ANOME